MLTHHLRRRRPNSSASGRQRAGGHRLLPSSPCTLHASQPPPSAATPPPSEKLDYMTRRLEMEPIAWNQMVPSAVSLGGGGGGDPAALEFRKIVCEGDFDEEKSLFVGPPLIPLLSLAVCSHLSS
ncbi:hypothetical protein GUJ93_ZPchr0006g41687 [Zizania palustris]|uniref:Uncharacterized protein n=1 Tax=Zizania palustris TaxID=103762 RepID=A0A8J5VW26_ZIZPA|nr:hypothetical protein GUJ93_ZPchr0006g41687 [Zizania palustris]